MLLCCRYGTTTDNAVVLQVRDDNKRQHPCLVEFSKLPEQERSYNLQMSLETLKTLLALGCHVGLADEHAVEKVKNLKLSAT
uniref:Ryanodine receptor Ryr domain-containing protein n=1 Tax=Oncorhynchus tshawytscha TaxID=74940 RepID=A0AAZ3R9A1_ONCTS